MSDEDDILIDITDPEDQIRRAREPYLERWKKAGYTPQDPAMAKIDPETQGSPVCGFCTHFISSKARGFQPYAGTCIPTLKTRWHFDVACQHFSTPTENGAPDETTIEINFQDDEGSQGC